MSSTQFFKKSPLLGRLGRHADWRVDRDLSLAGGPSVLAFRPRANVALLAALKLAGLEAERRGACLARPIAAPSS